VFQVRTYLAVLIALAVCDAAWLSMVAVKMFQNQVGPVLRADPSIGAIVAFYLVYAAGVVMLAVRPALAEGSVTRAVVNGSVLGLTAYATFDLTNLAIIRGWTVGLAAIDMAWGTFLTMIASGAGFIAGSRRDGGSA
jgi:uncharacterized membrane protein